MSDITVINDSEQSSLVTNGLAKNGELYLKAAGSTDEGAIVVYDSGAWRTFANEFSAGFANDYSVDFDGSNDRIDCGTVSDLNSASTFSISVWYKKSSAGAGGLIIGAGSLSGERVYIEHFSNNTIYVGYDSTFASVSSTADTNWHHVVYVRDSGTHKLYLEGSDMSLGGTPASTTGSSAGNNFNIGRLSGYGAHFGGLIDEAAVFSSALSASNVTAIYNSGIPTDLASYSPVHWWRMGDDDGGTGTTITDQGSGGNDGTLINGPTFSSSVPS